MTSKHTRYLSTDEFEKFLNTIPKLPLYHSPKQELKLSVPKFQLLCKMLYYCALTSKEVLSLKKSDFNLEEKTLTIRESRGNTNLTTIPPNLIRELSSFLEKLKPNDSLFKVHRMSVWRLVQDVGKLTGINILSVKKQRQLTTFRPGLFRESYKQLMLNNDADIDLADLKLRAASDSQYGGYTLDNLKEWEKKFFKKEYLPKSEIVEYVKWYEKNRPLYVKLSEVVKEILERVFEDTDIEIHTIDARAKTLESFSKKIHDGVNFKPKEMQDLAGIRIICYIKSDEDKINHIIKKTFDIDNVRSRDKSKILGENLMGYQSVQYVAKFNSDRTKLGDFKKFEGIFFEIQVRTILQHAWAEIEHDRMYKNVKLPRRLRRRFYLVSGILEVADNEFDQLHHDIP